MTSSEVYRQWAAACLDLAQRVPDEQSRATYLQMAESWRELAEKAEARKQSDK